MQDSSVLGVLQTEKLPELGVLQTERKAMTNQRTKYA
jgi:hypothetical protein